MGAVVSLLGARSFAAAAAFIGNVLVARQLGDLAFGQFYILFSLMTIVAGLTGPAIDTSLVRFAVKHITPGRDGSAPYFRVVLHAKFYILVLTILVGVAAAWALPRYWFDAVDVKAVSPRAIVVAFIGGAAVSLWGFSQSYFLAHQRFSLFSGYEFCSSLLRLGLVLGLLAAGSARMPFYLLAYVAAPLTMAAISWTQLPWRRFAGRPAPSEALEFFRFARWVILATVFTTLTQRLDIMLLQNKAFGIPGEIVGRYSAAVTIVLAGELVLLTFYSVLLPKASALRTAGELREFIGKFRMPTLLACLVLASFIPFSGPFCRIVLGPGYEGADEFLSILLIGVIVSIASAPTVTALYSLGQSGMVCFFEGARLLLTLLPAPYVVQHHGALGMAVLMASVRAGTSAAGYLFAHQSVKRRMIREDSLPTTPPEV